MPMRPGRCYSHITSQPYTRKEYIHGVPQPKITKFETGNKEMMEKYEVKLDLISLEIGQIRSNALESARIMTGKFLNLEVGEGNFYMRIPKYPHQVIRENKMMAFAGADRLQDGMRLSFGKPIGVATIVKAGDKLIEVWGRKGDIEKLKEALRRGAAKFPVKTRIIVSERRY